MSHRSRLALIAAAVGLLVPAAVAVSPASAASALAQDLTVSVTSGPPGTVIELSSPTCVATDDVDAYLEVLLISGTAPD